MEPMGFLHLSNNSSIYETKQRDVACLEGRRFGVLEYDSETPFSPQPHIVLLPPSALPGDEICVLPYDGTMRTFVCPASYITKKTSG
jgi:hypothetical protein